MAVSIQIPEQAEVSFKLEIVAKANVTPYGAKQIVDDFLLNSVGNLLYASEPEFFISEAGIFWRVPVDYALPSKGKLGTVGSLLVDIQTGEIVRSIKDIEQIQANAENLYRIAISQTE